MINRIYPIIIGGENVSRKCVIVARDGGHMKAAICKLKDGTEHTCGDEDIPYEDIEGIMCEIWFSTKESLKAFTKVFNTMIERWCE